MGDEFDDWWHRDSDRLIMLDKEAINLARAAFAAGRKEGQQDSRFDHTAAYQEGYLKGQADEKAECDQWTVEYRKAKAQLALLELQLKREELKRVKTTGLP